ncbi:hypothetical protein CY34DRAFT_813397, partial [Suillus luteus UH-Slu-Lm8-n1]
MGSTLKCTSRYLKRCFINSLTEVTEDFSFQVLILLSLCPSPSIPNLPVMLVCDKGE